MFFANVDTELYFTLQEDYDNNNFSAYGTCEAGFIDNNTPKRGAPSVLLQHTSRPQLTPGN